MRVIMTLLVRDEEDIVESNIRYHLTQGVDLVIATDHRSRDSTRDILRHFENEGVVRLIVEESQEYAQNEWVTRMARIAHEEHGADWVVHSDADEFWFPLHGDIPEALAAVPEDIEVIRAERHDFVPVDDDGTPLPSRMRYRKRVSLNSLGRPLPHKVAHRGHPAVSVAMGNHSVLEPEMKVEWEPARFEIMHFPMRTYEQFSRKIAKGSDALARNERLEERFGATWRTLGAVHAEGGLRAHFDEAHRSEEEIREGLADGSLIEDARLVDFLISAGIIQEIQGEAD